MRQASAPTGAGAFAEPLPELGRLCEQLRRQQSSQHASSSAAAPCREAVGRFRGGGGDGGSTGAESRSSYLEMYKEKKQEMVDPAQLRCAATLSQECRQAHLCRSVLQLWDASPPTASPRT